jgi:MoxR-like ATPase
LSDYRYTIRKVLAEVQKAIVGKEEVTKKIMLAILAGGHVLVEDIPGTGKTTMALAFSKAMGLKEKRVQFTPDILPADLTGFNLYQKDAEQFVYQPGAVMCNFFLADELNRASPKTQSALLEVMAEGQVTVDGVTRRTGNPFIVIATENPAGFAGTQLLPEAQLDRFMILLNMGYPAIEEEIEILRRARQGRTTDAVENVISPKQLLEIRGEVSNVYIHDDVYTYIAELAKTTREKEPLATGISPRGTVALAAMSRAEAYLRGRDYVVPGDVAEVFVCVAAHRVQLSAKARIGHIKTEDILEGILKEVKVPSIKKR